MHKTVSKIAKGEKGIFISLSSLKKRIMRKKTQKTLMKKMRKFLKKKVLPDPLLFRRVEYLIRKEVLSWKHPIWKNVFNQLVRISSNIFLFNKTKY